MLQMKVPTRKFNMDVIIRGGMPIKHTPKASGVFLICHLIYYHLSHAPQTAPPESGVENQPFVHKACS